MCYKWAKSLRETLIPFVISRVYKFTYLVNSLYSWMWKTESSEIVRPPIKDSKNFSLRTSIKTLQLPLGFCIFHNKPTYVRNWQVCGHLVESSWSQTQHRTSGSAHTGSQRFQHRGHQHPVRHCPCTLFSFPGRLDSVCLSLFTFWVFPSSGPFPRLPFSVLIAYKDARLLRC